MMTIQDLINLGRVDNVPKTWGGPEDMAKMISDRLNPGSLRSVEIDLESLVRILSEPYSDRVTRQTLTVMGVTRRYETFAACLRVQHIGVTFREGMLMAGERICFQRAKAGEFAARCKWAETTLELLHQAIVHWGPLRGEENDETGRDGESEFVLE